MMNVPQWVSDPPAWIARPPLPRAPLRMGLFLGVCWGCSALVVLVLWAPFAFAYGVALACWLVVYLCAALASFVRWLPGAWRRHVVAKVARAARRSADADAAAVRQAEQARADDERRAIVGSRDVIVTSRVRSGR